MAIHIRSIFFQILLITFVNTAFTATKKRIRISDDLHDVKDDQEDEAWIEWGQKKKMTVQEFDPPPENFSDLDLKQMQDEVMKRQVGQSYGFIKLWLADDQRTRDMVAETAEKWTNLARTGAIGVTFMGFDLYTVMFTLQNAQNTLEFRDFMLDQPEAYEVKMGEQFFRRPGDPPFEDRLKELHRGKKKSAISPIDTDTKTEL